MNTALPFDGFLDLLRSKGFGVGLHEYRALATLLERWDRTDVEEFCNALAALVGRSDEEVQAIRRLFFETYLTAQPSTPPSRPPVSPPLVWQRWAWSAAVVAAIVIVGLTIRVLVGRQAAVVPSSPPQSATPFEASRAAPTLVAPLALPPPPPPSLPPPPRRVDRPIVAAIVAAVFFVCLAIFWALKTREATDQWARRIWSAALAALPGPFHFALVLRDRASGLPKPDIEDAATVLGRAFTADTPARELDVRHSIRLTLRSGLLAQLVFKARRTAQPILVVQDVSQNMRMWRAKVDTFLTDLKRQAIALDRWYFDDDPRRVSESPYRAVVRFETVVRRRHDSPVLVISAGNGIAATLATGDDAWLAALGPRIRKSWLTPVADPSLWPPALNILPLDVWPMTRDGLARAAQELAGIEGEPRAALKSQLALSGRVTQDEIERLKRLASVVPHPTPELLDMLRRKFAPDVSDAAILAILSETEVVGSPVIRLTDNEAARCLAAMRRETPALEAAVRRTVLDVLIHSQPPSGSAAHQRWQLSLAVQQLQLAQLEHHDPSGALETLGLLGAGPLWEEVAQAVRRLELNPTLTRRVDAALGKSRGGRARPPEPSAVAGERQPWSWPGIRELVPAIGGAAIVLAIGPTVHIFPAHALDHLRDAYRLDYVDLPAHELRVRAAGAPMPNVVDVFQGVQVFKANLPLPPQSSVPIPLTSADTGKYYQARALLRDGNLAVSNIVWVPSDTEIIVAIDARPWANITIRGEQSATAPQPTPFSASLLPGRYRLTFDNNGVTPPMEQTIDVTPASRVFNFTMPGFDASRTAAELTRPNPAK